MLIVLEGRVVHVTDPQAETEEYPEGSAAARELGHRTVLAVPLLREGAPLGAINLRRDKVEPFTDKQIELGTVPIVFVNVTDPVGAGFVDSLARPGGNATGF